MALVRDSVPVVEFIRRYFVITPLGRVSVVQRGHGGHLMGEHDNRRGCSAILGGRLLAGAESLSHEAPLQLVLPLKPYSLAPRMLATVT